MGFSKNRNTSEISYMTNVSYKAANRSNTLCIARFDNAGNDICHRKFAVREVFRGSLIFSPLWAELHADYLHSAPAARYSP